LAVEIASGISDCGESAEERWTMIGRVLRTGLSSLRDRAANLRRRLAALRFNPSRVTITEYYSHPMTPEMKEHFDEAFRQMDIAFVNMDKAFEAMRKVK
jgi:hypothetical protein